MSLISALLPRLSLERMDTEDWYWLNIDSTLTQIWVLVIN